MSSSPTNDEELDSSNYPSLHEETGKGNDGGQQSKEKEDEIVAQARAFALSAAMLSKHKKGTNKGLNILTSITADKEELPLGDIEQRKLIEAKLGQKMKQQQDQPNPLKAVSGLADVKDKIDVFIKEQQQKIEDTWSHKNLVSSSRPSSPTRSGSPVRLKDPGSGFGTGTDKIHGSPNRALPIPIMEEKGSNVNAADASTSAVKVEDDAPVILSSVVYKRRSGYGRYSTSRPWEKRRMDLKGTTIRYFKTIKEQVDTTSSLEKGKNKETEVVNSEDEPSRPCSPLESTAPIVIDSSGHNTSVDTSADAQSTKQKKKDGIRDFWEQAKENITKTTENLTTSLTAHNQPLDPNAPRGTIDLINENATVAALSVTENASSMAISMGSYGGTPTPFGICIRVKDENKWKICFDTQKEQMQWLVALTDIIVKNTVETYNDELTKSRRGIPMSPGTGTPLRHLSPTNDEIIPNDNAEEVFRSPPGGRDDALWKTDDRFSMSNLLIGADADKGSSSNILMDDYDDNKDKESASELLDQGSKDKTGNELKLFASDSPIGALFALVNRGAISGPAVSLMGNNIYLFSGFFNVALYIAFSLQSKWIFRIFLISANALFWLLVTSDPESEGKGKGESIGKDKSGTKQFRYSALLVKIASFKVMQARSEVPSNVDSPKKIKKKVPSKIKEGFKPILGSSTRCIKDSSNSTTINGQNLLKWDVLALEDVQVRSHGYLQTKKKMPSPSTLYEIVGCEILKSDMRVSDFATKVELPKMNFEGDDKGDRTWISPDIFVVTLAVPTAEPSITRPTTDGEGFSLTIYYKMKDETRKILRSITAPEYDPSSSILEEEENEPDVQRRVVNAVKLWEEWCTKAPNDEKMQARFKFIPNIHNPKEIGLPSYISKYCGKPVLVKRANVTGFLSSYPNISAMEFGISLHPFPYLAKKAMAYLKSNVFPKAIVSLSYVIEGRSDEELPEMVIGDGVKIIYPDPLLAFDYNDFVAGASGTDTSDKTNCTE